MWCRRNHSAGLLIFEVRILAYHELGRILILRSTLKMLCGQTNEYSPAKSSLKEEIANDSSRAPVGVIPRCSPS